MIPYYDQDGITIYHGDCREVGFQRGDVMVTDPPYGMGFVAGKNNGGSRNKDWSSRWAGTALVGDESTELRDEVLTTWDGPALVFGSWKTSIPAGVREVLVWDKVVSTGMGALDIPWRPSWEAIYVIGQGFVGSRSHGVLRYPLPTLAPERRDHPTVKPVELMRDLIGKCPGGVVVDPFMGSGSTLRAAKDLGRKATGIEIDERYCEVAALRLAQGVFDLAGV